MIKQRLQSLKNKFQKYHIDGYVVPKNDEFFSEYSAKDRLKFISNFSGSAGFAVILKKKNFLFVDSRYTIQAQLESKKNFEIVDFYKIINCKLFKNLTLGVDPKLFTSENLKKFFPKNKIQIIETNLIDQIFKKKSISSKPFYSLSEKIAGEDYKKKITKITKYLKKKNSNYIFITAPENVAWLLNIRGKDSPYSPIPNCHLFLDNKNNLYLITKKKNIQNLLKEKKLNSNNLIEPQNFKKFIYNQHGKKIIIDKKSCSIFYENILHNKFKVLKQDDPIYLLKSLKNKIEISNLIKSHIADGVALTKFLHWIKKVNNKVITEVDAQDKLERFRKRNKNYLYPSFNTIAATGENGAIVHYRATKKNNREIKKNDLFLCDSGGQYKYGTTDVTRTICFTKPRNNIKNIFTKVLKGHIAVAQTNLNKKKTGELIDIQARKFLKRSNLDYKHGTGHGVGFFLNVHEGPQAISKFNKIRFSEGMVVSNEPGYYKRGQFGIRIENLLYVKKIKKNLFFENLTLAPIDYDLIDYKKLTKSEKDYLFRYNILIYTKLSPYLTRAERHWLASFI
ncbi:aminopeptidase P family protein [Candidatus Pelagibacter sp.]|nr:aminopeptidase P family protein [Candidatus Pelagibacter sp.]|tara:strand:+ start:465 stop:2159 length:1695 start_codon:yes stop_codon:yes gene_type:complete